jgi:transcriptional regulator with XRE-family HTH domain
MEIKVGEIIRSRREEMGINLVDMAKRLDISPGYLSQIETGRKTNPKLEIILRILHELDLDISMLLGLEPTEQSYFNRMPPLLKMVLARERNLKVLEDGDILKKYCALSEKMFDVNYVLQNKILYSLFMEDVFLQTENMLKRYLALQMIFSTDDLTSKQKKQVGKL